MEFRSLCRLSRYVFPHAVNGNEPIGLFGILIAVQIESFLWGLGTALGELPPYFVAKKASETRAELRRMSDKAEGHKMVVDEEEEKIIEKEKGHHELSSE
jgi:hypothetical protein